MYISGSYYVEHPVIGPSCYLCNLDTAASVTGPGVEATVTIIPVDMYVGGQAGWGQHLVGKPILTPTLSHPTLLGTVVGSISSRWRCAYHAPACISTRLAS